MAFSLKLQCICSITPFYIWNAFSRIILIRFIIYILYHLLKYVEHLLVVTK
uniref:Uncharacterized protein n=1 Tax=Anguilla anguilla TaxID=7936 RepID=A0A0E9U366_ANGAN